MQKIIVSLCILLMAGCATNKQASETSSQETSPRDLMIGLMGKAPPEPDMQEVNRYPLGSKYNPVRVNGPKGEQDYMGRLVCANGDDAKFERSGSAGKGPYGFVLDRYKIVCTGSEDVEVFVDMYHPNHSETAGVSGLTLKEKS